MDESNTKLLTRAEVADLLGVSVKQVRELVRTGRLAEAELGHHTRRYSRAAVDALVKASTGTTAPEGGK